jgi:PAS domain S-box-containing protein
MDGTPSRHRQSVADRLRGNPQLWLWYLAGGVAVAIAAAPYKTASLAVDALLAVLTCVVMAYAPRWYPVLLPRIWWLLVAGQTIVALTAVVMNGYHLWTGHTIPFPSPVTLPYLLVYPLFSVALVLRLRARGGGAPRGAALDTTIVTIGLATMLWEFVAQPAMGPTRDIASGALLLGLAGAAFGTGLLVIAARLIIVIGTQARLVLLGTGFCALLLSDTLGAASAAAHPDSPAGGRVILLIRMVSHILLGAAALHRGPTDRSADPKVGTITLSRGRLAIFVGLALLAPAMVLLRTAWGSTELDRLSDVLVPVSTAAAISVLLIIRLSQIATLASDRAADLDRQAVALERSHQALFQARQRFQAMFESAPTGMAQLNHHGRVLAANTALATFLGRTRAGLVGTQIANFVHPEDVGELQELLIETLRGLGGARSRTLRCNHMEGRQLWADLVMSAVDGLGAARTAILVIADRTEARQLEVELRHAQKLEGIGRLAAGVAHELNTPIQFIGDNVDFITTAALQLLDRAVAVREQDRGRVGATEFARLTDGLEIDYLTEEIPEAARQTRDGVRRVATIVQALKRFAHPATAVHQPADLNRALLDTVAVARNELKQVAEVRTELADLPPVVCSVGDLNQVFLNLLINAAHAVAEVPGEGFITVRSVLSGTDVVIEISDTGPGIPEELREKVFEPFFTTKPVGMGTGQGLALARAIVVDGHGGAIDFVSEPGEGTTFVIQLPVQGHDRRALADAFSSEGF